MAVFEEKEAVAIVLVCLAIAALATISSYIGFII